jgi:uncharacterized protein (DUF427 family)
MIADDERGTPPRARESVWDYPRPPQVETTDRHVRVEAGGEVIADTRRALRVLETSHPPVYYIPLEDMRRGLLRPSSRRTVCEFKGVASYHDLVIGELVIRDAAWSYAEPRPGYESLRDHLAFYPAKMDACYVDDERVVAQPGDFYGGWITSDIEGPFKGGPGTRGW